MIRRAFYVLVLALFTAYAAAQDIRLTPEEAAAVIAKETLMKAAPSANAGTLQTLSYDLVAVIDWEVDDADKTSAQKWVKLKTRKGEGYVPEEHIRSPLEYRACFAKSG